MKRRRGLACICLLKACSIYDFVHDQTKFEHFSYPKKKKCEYCFKAH